MTGTDWTDWHAAYDRPDSGLGDRLAAVRREIHRHLDDAGRRPVRVVSACAGDGRDLLGVLEERTDADRVDALLVEQDPRLAARARERANDLAAHVEIREGDAGHSDTYADSAPAHLLMLCGIFGNISDADIRTTIQAARQLCAPGADIVWTRHRWEPDLTADIRAWFEQAGCRETAFVSPGPGEWAVGAHRLERDPEQSEPGRRWFTFLR